MEVLNSTYKCTHTSVQKYNHNQCNWNFWILSRNFLTAYVCILIFPYFKGVWDFAYEGALNVLRPNTDCHPCKNDLKCIRIYWWFVKWWLGLVRELFFLWDPIAWEPWEPLKWLKIYKMIPMRRGGKKPREIWGIVFNYNLPVLCICSVMHSKYVLTILDVLSPVVSPVTTVYDCESAERARCCTAVTPALRRPR